MGWRSEPISEIEKHLHSYASWFGLAGTPTASHKADRLGNGIAAFQLDAGNETWGNWVQLLGSGDTPARTGMRYFDAHELIISASENSAIYFLQLGIGATGAAALTAGTYSELVIDTTSKAGGVVIEVQIDRAAAGSLLWARCLAIGQNTSTIDLYFGIHEYLI